MYSVVLMAAMTTGTAEAPAFHVRSWGCAGGLVLHSGRYANCMGCVGWGNGACYGAAGFAGANGGGWAAWGAGCVGCWGCMGCYGVYTGPVMTPAGNPMQAPAVPGSAPGAGSPPTAAPKAAQLIIEKPADAQIFVDNQPVKSEGLTQSFATPVLEPSQAYYYMVRVEMNRDGKSLSESRRVIVRAGQTLQETFRDPGVSTASLKISGR
jgi:uncharacterized protein (TIGR03000 family)